MSIFIQTEGIRHKQMSQLLIALASVVTTAFKPISSYRKEQSLFSKFDDWAVL